jgi:hypothetical protein
LVYRIENKQFDRGIQEITVQFVIQDRGPGVGRNSQKECHAGVLFVERMLAGNTLTDSFIDIFQQRTAEETFDLYGNRFIVPGGRKQASRTQIDVSQSFTNR